MSTVTRAVWVSGEEVKVGAGGWGRGFFSEAGEIWEGEQGQQKNDKNTRQPTFQNDNVSHSQT